MRKGDLLRRSVDPHLCRAKFGVNVPLVPMEHQYMVTEPFDGVPADLPTLRDPDRLTYYKEEVGGLVMGGYEPNPIPWAVNGHPAGFSLHPARQQLRPLRTDDGAGAGSRARAWRTGWVIKHADQRAGELHARRQFHHRRGAGA